MDWDGSRLLDCSQAFHIHDTLLVDSKNYTFDFEQPKYLSLSMGDYIEQSDCPVLDLPREEIKSSDKVVVIEP